MQPFGSGAPERVSGEYRDQMDERAGMGSEPHGPSFTPPHSLPTRSAHHSPARRNRSAKDERTEANTRSTRVERSGPRAEPSAADQPRTTTDATNRWSAILTAAAVLLVGLVVTIASVITAREDSRPVASRVPASPVSATRTERTGWSSSTADADGVLIVTSRIWSASGVRRPAFGTYLHVEVELVCRNGTFAYGPENFSAFDATGELFEVSSGGRWGTPLGYGILLAGDTVRGTIAFDLPRGDVTLLMSDDSSSSVTAVKIPD